MSVAHQAVTENDLTQAQRLRVLAGFVVQPFASAAVGFVTFPLLVLTDPRRHQALGGDLRGAMSVAFGVALVAVFVTAFGALPALAWCMKHGRLRFRQVVGWGALLGNVPFVVILGLAYVTNNISGPVWDPIMLGRVLAFGSLLGVAGSAVFWVIAVRGTPLGAKRKQ